MKILMASDTQPGAKRWRAQATNPRQQVRDLKTKVQTSLGAQKVQNKHICTCLSSSQEWFKERVRTRHQKHCLEQSNKRPQKLLIAPEEHLAWGAAFVDCRLILACCYLKRIGLSTLTECCWTSYSMVESTGTAWWALQNQFNGFLNP